MSMQHRRDVTRHYTDEMSLGPAMRKLTVLQRNFVINMSNRITKNNADALRDAGWQGSFEGAVVEAHYMLRDDTIQEALIEESRKRVRAFVPMAVSELGAMIDNPQTKEENKLKAIGMVLDRAGLHALSENKTTIESVGQDGDLLKRVAALAAGLGLDVSRLLGNRIKQPVIVDAEYEEQRDFLNSVKITTIDDLI